MRAATHSRVHLGSLLCLAVFAWVALFAPSKARAQYMYLDSNGDGVHSAADVLPSGGAPRTVDVWLVTDRNRDASPAVCPYAGYTMNIFSYEFCLRAVDGRVAFSGFTNRMDASPFQIFAGGTTTEFYVGQFGSVPQPPGLYRLATLSVSVTSGAPSLQIVPDAPTLEHTATSPPETAFGSFCGGVLFNNTIQLGVDWFDVDGLASSTPSAGGAPVLAPLTNITVNAGNLAVEGLAAADPDADPVTFTIESAPTFLDATTGTSVGGTTMGALHAGPHVDDIGMHSATVAASDGSLVSRQSLNVQVVAGPNHPPVSAIFPSVTVVAGSTWRRTVLARDFDGQTLSLQKSSGPDFLSAGIAAQGEGGALGYVRVGPSLCDAGDYDGAITMGDGLTSVVFPIHISVRPAQPPPPPDLIQLPTGQYPDGLAAGDLNGDGIADLVAANESSAGTISVFVSEGEGHFAPERTYQLTHFPGALSSVVLADFNADGRLDAAAGARRAGTVSILLGDGNGAFAAGPVILAGNSPEALLAVDLNDDGKPDLAVADGSGSAITILLGAGDGTFTLRAKVHVAGGSYGLTAGDWDRDGRLDLASAGAFFNPVSLLFGHGDGTYREPVTFAAGRSPVGIVGGDWNNDGSPDLAVADYDGALLIFRGNGSGGFTKTNEFGGFTAAQSVAAGDLNGDGVDDLVLSDVLGFAAQVFRGDGAGGFTAADRIVLPRGAYQSAIGDMDGDAVPDLAMTDSQYGAVFVRRFAPAAEASGFARAFVTGGHRPVSLGASPPAYCARLEPVANSFAVWDVDPTSVLLVSQGTGSVEQIHAVIAKQGVVGDMDHNGVAELPVCFAGEDLSRLFDRVTGRREVVAQLQGRLVSGRFFCTNLSLDVQGNQKPLLASVSPNPLNPSGTLRFTTTRRGSLKVSVLDLQGRHVRTLMAAADAPAGLHRIAIDGRTDSGSLLATGIYFFRIEAAEGVSHGRFSVLK